MVKIMSVKKTKLIIEVKVPDGTTHYSGNIDDTFVTWYKKDGHKVCKWGVGLALKG